MRVGIGLPAAVPETDMTLMGRWAREAERAGFESVGAIDRLIYDNLAQTLRSRGERPFLPDPDLASESRMKA